tara:strand:+ start:386 stop:595 length:210 start_codon:yes stop_codon:yes gene_type:complete
MKNRFLCVVSINDNELHKKEYKTLKDISDELNLTYQQVADLSVGRPNKFMNNKFKYSPIITIEKISNQL